jgi:arsenite-transporting ATPase
MRIIIYTGKGGVGKTSVSAATALKSAALGYKTIVISTDAAHSLSDSLEVQLTGDITHISENLDGLEIDIQHELETKWSEIQQFFADFLAAQGIETVTAKEMAIFPGMEMISALLYVWEFNRTQEYDVVVMDTAPTADTLRLLAFPDIADWYFEHTFHMIKNLLRLARATIGRMVSTPLPSDKFLEDIEELRTKIRAVREILVDPKITSIRLVVNPEKMVISETQRAYTYLCLYGYTVESIIVNRVIPEEASQSFLDEKLDEQKRHLATIDEAFSPLRMFRARLMPREVLGKAALVKLAANLFGKEDPTQVFSLESPMRIYDEDGFSILSVKLPFLMNQNVELYTRGDNLTLQLGAFKKSISLPYVMTNKKVLSAEWVEGWLKIKFEGEALGKRPNRKRGRGSKKVRKAR